MEGDSEKFNSSSEFTDFNVEQNIHEFNEEFSQRTLTTRVIFGLIAFVGFFANVVVVYIYGVRYKPCNFKYFLFVMGLIGIVQCCIMLPTQIAEMHYWFVFPTSWLCRVSAYVFGYTCIACYFILLLISIDRFRKVCRPYDWQIQSHTARNLCLVVSIASLVFALPPGIISGHHSYVTSYNGGNITVTVCATDDIFKDRDWAISCLLLFGGIPVSIVILVTCTLYGLILKQFYNGPAFTLKSLYNTSSTRVVENKTTSQALDTIPPAGDDVNSPETSPEKKKLNNKLEPTPNIGRHVSTLRKVISSILPNRTDSIRSDKPKSGPLRTSGSNISKNGVRKKLMRKTCIVLIITVTCIIALVITFCLHGVAENVNRNVLSTSSVQLNAFVIFHRGSFSIICAIFPIIYGTRDPKFRNAFLQIFVKSAQTAAVIAQNSIRDDSQC